MSAASFQRALVLTQQGRHALAEPEWRQALADDPDNSALHAQLALCLAAQERWDEAAREADEAVGLGPDVDFAHYARAVVACDRNRFDEAAASADEALRLDPDDADYHVLAGQIKAHQRRWTDALAAAERALALDPEHVNANNLRATALVQLGRKDEADATLAAALSRDPDNAQTHANAGFAALHRGDHRQALEHFREALRLDADHEAARAGLVEALKAQNPIYRVMLAYFLWMARLPSGLRWGLILGIWFGQRALRGVVAQRPELGPVLWPVIILAGAFVVMTWIADPLFNLLLRLNRYGRHALDRDQRRGTNLLLAGLALLALNGAGWGLGGPWLPALAAALWLLPSSAVYHCQAGWPRWLLATIVAVLALPLLLAGVSGVAAGVTASPAMNDLHLVAAGASVFALFGIFITQFIALGLQSVTVKR